MLLMKGNTGSHPCVWLSARRGVLGIALGLVAVGVDVRRSGVVEVLVDGIGPDGVDWHVDGACLRGVGKGTGVSKVVG